MKVRRTAYRPAWLSLALLALVLGSTWGSASGETLPPPMGLVELKPGAPMPAFRLPDLSGATVDASAFQGKVVVVRFWATW
jgi:cytochrome oxidase Cu insertion factor (SCO1/SenC/PrrC family)